MPEDSSRKNVGSNLGKISLVKQTAVYYSFKIGGLILSAV